MVDLQKEWEEASPDIQTEWDQAKPPGEWEGSAGQIQGKPLYKEVLEEVPTIAGSIFGGTAATMAKRIPLVGLLSAGGEGYKQVYQHLTDDPNAPKTSLEAAKRMLFTGGEQAAGQFIGEKITKLAGKAVPHIKEQYLVPGLEKAEKNLRPFMEKYLPKNMRSGKYLGPGFSVSQKAEPFSAAAKMESILESSFFGATPIKQFKYAQEKAIEDYGATLSKEVWQTVDKLPPSEIGLRFRTAYDTAYKSFNSQAVKLYNQVDEMAVMSNSQVDMVPLKRWANGVRAERVSDIGSTQTGNTLLEKILSLPDSVSFKQAQNIRTGLRLEKQGFEAKDIARGLATKGEQLTNNAMDVAANNLPPGGRELWRRTNEFYKKGVETLDNEFIYKLATIAKEQPELVGKQLFQNGEITQIRQVKEVLMPSPDNPISKYVMPDQKTWQNMKAGYLENVFAKATDPQTNAMSASKLTNAFSERGMGTETLKEIFTPKELNIIKPYITALSAIGKKPAQASGSLLIQLMQAPALAGAITAYGGFKQDPEIIAGGVALLATPRILGKMIVSPRYHNLFVQGLSSSRPIALPAITKLAIEAYDINKNIQASYPVADKSKMDYSWTNQNQ